MFLEPKFKLKLVLGGLVVAIVLAAADPFIFSFGIGNFSKDVVQGVFLALDFLCVVFLWNQFNELRVIINKKELEDEGLSKLEREINRMSNTKV